MEEPQPLPPPSPRTNYLSFVVVAITFLLFGLAGGYYLAKTSLLDKLVAKYTTKACTLEAKLCPDGTSVGRTGPNCEFAPCPVTTNPIEGWKKFNDPSVNFTIEYPSDFTIISESNNDNSGLPQTLLSLERNRTFSNSHLTTRGNFLVQLIPNLKSTQACYILSDDGSPLTKFKTINGNTFYYADKPGKAGLGTIYVERELKLFQDIGDHCYQFDFKYSKSSDWNNPADQEVANKDQTETFNTFDQILSTFKFTDKNSSNTSSEIVIYVPPLDSNTIVKEQLQQKIISPYLDYFRETEGGGFVVSMTLSQNLSPNSTVYPYKIDIVYSNKGHNDFLVKQTNNVIDWWVPECMDCKFSDSFVNKYPEIVKYFGK